MEKINSYEDSFNFKAYKTVKKIVDTVFYNTLIVK